MIGQTFGRLTVINNPNITKGGKRYWECKCSCGRVILVPTGNLKSGNSSQCRACGNKNRKTKPRKHGETKTRLYRIWISMKSRCSNPATINFHRYGVGELRCAMNGKKVTSRLEIGHYRQATVIIYLSIGWTTTGTMNLIIADGRLVKNRVKIRTPHN